MGTELAVGFAGDAGKAFFTGDVTAIYVYLQYMVVTHVRTGRTTPRFRGEADMKEKPLEQASVSAFVVSKQTEQIM